MIISIYRQGKELDVTDVEVITGIDKYSIVANKLHYLSDESWKEVDLSRPDVKSVVLRQDVLQ